MSLHDEFVERLVEASNAEATLSTLVVHGLSDQVELHGPDTRTPASQCRFVA